MKTLVTGASGLLGYELCRQLKNIGHEVWAVDNLSRGKLTPPCDQWITADLTDGSSLGNQLPTNFDYIYHYGAINGTKNFYERPNQVMYNNMVGDFNMFAIAMRQTSLKKFIYASSSEIVSGDPVSPVPEQIDITLKDIHNPRWSYRLPKICSENFLANNRDFDWVAVRYFNIYGSQSKPGHFVADQIIKQKSGKFEIMGADETRSFCHVQDAMRATIFCGETISSQVINVGNDREILIQDAANIIAGALGLQDISWTLIPGLAGSTTNRRPDITKLREIMPDYCPMSFESGMKEVIDNGDWQ
jgi:UDP-glucose 4-epimerase